jgi:hypothetical protein
MLVSDPRGDRRRNRRRGAGADRRRGDRDRGVGPRPSGADGGLVRGGRPVRRRRSSDCWLSRHRAPALAIAAEASVSAAERKTPAADEEEASADARAGPHLAPASVVRHVRRRRHRISINWALRRRQAGASNPLLHSAARTADGLTPQSSRRTYRAVARRAERWREGRRYSAWVARSAPLPRGVMSSRGEPASRPALGFGLDRLGQDERVGTQNRVPGERGRQVQAGGGGGGGTALGLTVAARVARRFPRSGAAGGGTGGGLRQTGDRSPGGARGQARSPPVSRACQPAAGPLTTVNPVKAGEATSSSLPAHLTVLARQ